MKQKYKITVAGTPMTIVCEEPKEIVDIAVNTLNDQIDALLADKARFFTKADATALVALDFATRCLRLATRVQELEELLRRADAANGAAPEASLLQGENEALRGELQIRRGKEEALIEDNAALVSLNAKFARQSAASNVRADRMHDQVLSLLTEIHELREKLASFSVETHEPPVTYEDVAPTPVVELTEEERRVTEKYEHIDLDEILNTSPYGIG